MQLPDDDQELRRIALEYAMTHSGVGVSTDKVLTAAQAFESYLKGPENPKPA